MIDIIILFVLTILNYLVHRCLIEYDRHSDILVVEYIISFTPFINLALLLFLFFKDSYYLFKHFLEKNKDKKLNNKNNDIYEFKRFSFGYCICKNNEILTYYSSSREECKILLKKYDFTRLSYDGDFIFYNKNKKQVIESIKCLKAKLVCDKLNP